MKLRNTKIKAKIICTINALEIRMARMRTKNVDTKQRNCNIIYIHRYLRYQLVLVPQSDPMDCSLPGSSVHGVSQARILEWIPIPFSCGFSDAGLEPESPALQADSLSSEPQAIGKSFKVDKTISWRMREYWKLTQTVNYWKYLRLHHQQRVSHNSSDLNGC